MPTQQSQLNDYDSIECCGRNASKVWRLEMEIPAFDLNEDIEKSVEAEALLAEKCKSKTCDKIFVKRLCVNARMESWLVYSM